MGLAKSFIVDEQGNIESVVLDYGNFKRIESIMLDLGLAKTMEEVQDDDEIDLKEAKRIVGKTSRPTPNSHSIKPLSFSLRNSASSANSRLSFFTNSSG